MKKLSGDYIAGFVDGEGCFALNYRRDVRHDRKNKPVYYYWKIQFAITLREDDMEVLDEIRDSLNCGNITINKRGFVRYQVSNLDDLSNKIVPFFEKYTLRAKKRYDFELWRDALSILIRNKQRRLVGWSKEDIDRLVRIRQEMRNLKGGPGEWKWESHMSQNQHSATLLDG